MYKRTQLCSSTGEAESFSGSETFPPRIKIKFHYCIHYLIQIITLVTLFMLHGKWLKPKSFQCSQELTSELHPDIQECIFLIYFVDRAS